MVMSVIGILTNDRWMNGPYGQGKSKNKNQEPAKIKATARQKKYSEAIRFSARKILPVPPLVKVLEHHSDDTSRHGISFGNIILKIATKAGYENMAL